MSMSRLIEKFLLHTQCFRVSFHIKYFHLGKYLKHTDRVPDMNRAESRYSHNLKINRNSVAKYLEILLITGQVEMRMYGNAKVYYLSHRVPISSMLKFANELILVLDSDFKVRPDQIAAAITSRTRLIIFNSPSNPTGMVYNRSEIEKIARVVSKHEGVFVLSDEIYEHIIFEGEHASMASFDFIYDHVITMNGVSKGYAMTGWRIGYIGAPLWISKACNKLQGQFTSGVCSIAQRAALAALQGDGESQKIMRDAFLRRRNLVCGLLKEIDGLKVTVPQGAFYVMPDISYFLGKSDGETKIVNSDDLALFLLDKAQVATVGGDAFGAPDCLRISYATSDDLLVEAVKRIKEALKRLK